MCATMTSMSRIKNHCKSRYHQSRIVQYCCYWREKYHKECGGRYPSGSSSWGSKCQPIVQQHYDPYPQSETHQWYKPSQYGRYPAYYAPSPSPAVNWPPPSPPPPPPPPTPTPTISPSKNPTKAPTAQPSDEPSSNPTVSPSASPIASPTVLPSAIPSSAPSAMPSLPPSNIPTSLPSHSPSADPSMSPSSSPEMDDGGAFTTSNFRSIDGSEGGGRANIPLLRMVPANYPDNRRALKVTAGDNGCGDTIRQTPNPRVISNTLCNQSGPILNGLGMSDMVWQFGQFLDHDISLTKNNGDEYGYAPINVTEADDVFAMSNNNETIQIPFGRSDFQLGTSGPRQQINSITAYIDASHVYGSDQNRSDYLRTWEGGMLKISDGDLLPFNLDGLPNDPTPTHDFFFIAGDIRANEQLGLCAMHTIFVREHNRLADKIEGFFPEYTDELIYQIARKIVGAEMQIITYKEFLPVLLGPMAPSLDAYEGFNASVDPGITNEFSTGAYRFGHSMLSPSLMLANSSAVIGEISLIDSFFNPGYLTGNPEKLDLILGGLMKQRAQAIDTRLIDEVRNFLFQGHFGTSRLDLASLNIQRGRDHGLPSYNEARLAYGLERNNDFADITSDKDTQAALALVYSSPDEVDIWLGGLAEDALPGAAVGELVATILREQFARLMDGDSYFFLNDPDFSSTEMREIIEIEEWGLADVITLNTGLGQVRRNIMYVGE